MVINYRTHLLVILKRTYIFLLSYSLRFQVCVVTSFLVCFDFFFLFFVYTIQLTGQLNSICSFIVVKCSLVIPSVVILNLVFLSLSKSLTSFLSVLIRDCHGLKKKGGGEEESAFVYLV